MNEVALLVFGANKKYHHHTDGLNGCFAVFILSPAAVISAHIPPHPGANFKDPQAGDKNIVKEMQQIADLYKANTQHFSKPNTVLIFAMFHGKTALPDKKTFIEKCLRAFGVDIAVQDYSVKAPGDPRRDEYGTAFATCESQPARIFFEDRLVVRIFTEKAQIDTTGPEQECFLPADGIDRKVLEKQLPNIVAGACYRRTGHFGNQEGYYIDLPPGMKTEQRSEMIKQLIRMSRKR